MKWEMSHSHHVYYWLCKAGFFIHLFVYLTKTEQIN